jgi:phage repressor protein C with HTH and peptisase S24 domain
MLIFFNSLLLLLLPCSFQHGNKDRRVISIMQDNSRDFSVFKKRILQYLDIKGISKYECYQNTGITNGVFSQLNGMSEDNTLKFLSYYSDISSEWLLTGKGSMLKESNAELKPVKEIDFSISQFKQRGYAPYYPDLLVSAGQFDLMDIEQCEDPESWIKFPGIEVDGWFPIIGCSMEPKIYAGDIVGVRQLDGWERLDPDKTYLIITHDDRMIKHLETDDENKDILWAVSENYRRFKIEKTEIIRIFRVVWAGRLV